MDMGVILDLETTGLDPETDEIIEIGILEFGVIAGQEPRILNMYSLLQEPQEPLSETIEKLTGLNTSVLKNHKIDWKIIESSLSRASIVIAHNAAFDRGFIKRRSELAHLSLHWGCSQKHIDWYGRGFRTRSLNYLACDHGYVNPFAHRALFDCATTFRLITPYLSELIDKSYEKEYLLVALQAPFARKDMLKERGYQWEPKRRAWVKTVFESQREGEEKYLAEKIYEGASLHVVEDSTD